MTYFIFLLKRLFGIWVPIGYQNFYDTSFGERYPCHYIVSRNIFSGKIKTNFYGGCRLTNHGFLEYRKIWFTNNLKYFKLLNYEPQSIVIKMIGLSELSGSLNN